MDAVMDEGDLAYLKLIAGRDGYKYVSEWLDAMYLDRCMSCKAIAEYARAPVADIKMLLEFWRMPVKEALRDERLRREDKRDDDEIRAGARQMLADLRNGTMRSIHEIYSE
jgi:hypothetical protein